MREIELPDDFGSFKEATPEENREALDMFLESARKNKEKREKERERKQLALQKKLDEAYQQGVRDATEKIRGDVLAIENDFHGGDFDIDKWLKKYKRGTRLREALEFYFTQGEG